MISSNFTKRRSPAFRDACGRIWPIGRITLGNADELVSYGLDLDAVAEPDGAERLGRMVDNPRVLCACLYRLCNPWMRPDRFARRVMGAYPEASIGLIEAVSFFFHGQTQINLLLGLVVASPSRLPVYSQWLGELPDEWVSTLVNLACATSTD